MKKLVLCSTTLLFFLGATTAGAQKKASPKSKGTTKTNTATQHSKTPLQDIQVEKKDAADIPPEVERLEDTRIEGQTPLINFDTTAVVQDALTRSIVRLLSVTNALETDVKVVEESLKQNLATNNSPENQKFFERFMQDMREGRARRWLTNLYIRTYRNSFTEGEIEELISFYSTPIGKKLTQKQPQIMMQVLTEAQKIGSYMGATIMNEVMAENKQ